MNSFRLSLAMNNYNSPEEITIYNGILINLMDYFNKNNYNVNIFSITERYTDIEKLDQITLSYPDLFIYIDLLQYVSIKGMFISVYDKSYMNEKTREFSRVLDDNILNIVGNIHKYDITYDKSYMNRLRSFPSLSINISMDNKDYLVTKNAQKAIAKAIYKSIITSFVVPKIKEECNYITTANLNMKDKPDKTGSYLITIPKGSIVEILEKSSNIYWKIKVNIDGEDYIGYCIQTFIVRSKNNNI